MLWEKFASLKLGERTGNVNRTASGSLAADRVRHTQLAAILTATRTAAPR
jgi:hypothetical protein